MPVYLALNEHIHNDICQDVQLGQYGLEILLKDDYSVPEQFKGLIEGHKARKQLRVHLPKKPLTDTSKVISVLEELQPTAVIMHPIYDYRQNPTTVQQNRLVRCALGGS